MANRQKVIQSAEKLVARGRIQAAIDEYRKVLDRHPNDTTTLNRVGDLYARLNRMPKAIELFQQTAESFGRQGFFVKAIAIYKKIIRLDPSQIRAYENLADLYNRQGLTNDSLAQYQVVADYYEKHDDAKAATDVYFNMVSIEPNNPSRRLQLAGLLKEEGRVSQALDQYFEIADLMLGHSRGDDALRVLTEALEVSAEDLDFVRRSMKALQDAGFDHLAEQLLESAAKLNPEANALRLEALDDEEDPVETSIGVDGQLEVEQASGETAEDEEQVEVEAAKEAIATDEEEVELVVDEEESGEEATAATELATDSDSSLEFDLSEIAEMAESGSQSVDDAVVADADEASAEERGGDEAAEERTADGPDADAEIADVEVAVELETDDAKAVGDEAEVILDLDEGAEGVFELADDEPAEEPSAEEATAGDEGTSAATEAPKAPETGEVPARAQSEETIKLLVESEVLSRYGMDVMAITALEKILDQEEDNAEALARLVRLQLKLDRPDEALVRANQLADIVAGNGEPASWESVCEAMAERGFTLEEGRFAGEVTVAEPEAEVTEVSVEEAIEAEAGTVTDDEPSLEDMVADVDALERSQKAKPAATHDVLAEVIEEIEKDGDEEKAAAAEGSEWVEDLEEGVSAAATEDDSFVDLATELEAELAGVGDLDDDFAPGLQEQSLEDIVEGFRQGMAETLSDEDYDTHYNLGVAYSEMGLTDEAIGEFQLAAKDPRYLVECSSLLASCFVEKGFNDLAIQAYENGLMSPSLEDEQRMGLLYELGTLLAATGNSEGARERFVELYGINSNYRDVVARLEELKD